MLMAWIFFKEKPNRNSIIGALFVLSALVNTYAFLAYRKGR